MYTRKEYRKIRNRKVWIIHAHYKSVGLIPRDQSVREFYRELQRTYAEPRRGIKATWPWLEPYLTVVELCLNEINTVPRYIKNEMKSENRKRK